MKKLLILLAAVSFLAAAEPEQSAPKKSESFILEHRPTYVAFGDNKMNTIVQISMKYELLKNSNVYLGYTQYSMWELWRESSPFRDHNFNPEIFYRFSKYKDSYDFSIDAGYEHRSNGRDGDADRSMDNPYLTLEKGVSFWGVRLAWTNKFQYLVRMFGNPQLADYYGYWKTGLTLDFNLPWIEHEQLYVNFTPGTDSKLSRSTTEVGAKFRTPFGQNFAPYFFVQYWNGYLGSMLDYNVYAEGVRAGIILYH